MPDYYSNVSDDEVVDRVLAMRKVEDSYAYESFLLQSSDLPSRSSTREKLSVTWREKICHWSYNVVDHFDLSREVVTVSMDIFDRYLATQGNECPGSTVLLASLTTLNLAIKLHETKRIKTSTLASLSRNEFGTRDIEDMEWKVVSALQWKLLPPTPLAYISDLVQFLPEDQVDESERKRIFELAKYMAELAVCESSFVSYKSSTIALAAILVALEDSSSHLPQYMTESFREHVSKLCGQGSRQSRRVRTTKDRLQVMFAKASGLDKYTLSPPTSHKTVQVLKTSPCSTASKIPTATSSSHHVGKNHTRSNSRTNFWYTPSPPYRHVAVTGMGF